MFNKNLYHTSYHQEDLSNFKFLVTGGAGFIGSNIVEYLLKYNAGHVRVLDNLSNGYFENIQDFMVLPNFEFIEGDIRDQDTCKRAVKGMHYISHQAALGSVPRSILDPITTNEVNISGFLNMLIAAKDSSTLKQFVYAASSSSYGDSIILPKIEGQEGNPLSPYAVTKYVNELYADVFSKVYGFHSIGLRYFNVYGPKQNPKNPYAAVIPIFCLNFIENIEPIIYGDGETSRDFTFIENAIQANIKAMLVGGINNHEVINIACGHQITLNILVETLKSLSQKELRTNFLPERIGDVKHSRANIEKAFKLIKYSPLFNFKDGIALTYKHYKNDFKSN